MTYALIGCGRVAPYHIAAAKKNGLEIIAVCDINEDAMQNLCISCGLGNEVLRFKSHKDLLENIKPDLVAIATESGSHGEISKDVINAGCNIIIEKPISLSMKEAREIVSLCKEKGVVASACHQNRFNIAIQKTREAMDEGRLGRISHGAITVRWSRNRDYYAQDGWRGTWENDGGALMNQCIHGFDLLRWMLGGEIQEVYGVLRRQFHPYIEAEDVGMAVIKFKNGSVATAEGTTNVFDSGLDTETLSIYGENGLIEIGGCSANEITRWSFKEKRQNDVEDKEITEKTKNVYGNGHITLYADVVSAIKEGRAPYVTVEDGAAALELILAIYKSFKTCAPVSLPLGDFSTAEMKDVF